MPDAVNMMTRNKGYYIGFLKDTSCETNHAIAVDTINNKIYDCADKYVLQFNEKALNLCVGKETKFKSFSSLYVMNVSKK